MGKRVRRTAKTKRSAKLDLNGPIGRRAFVQGAGAAVLATAYGCSEPNAPGSGIVRITITGLGSEVTTAGIARINGGNLTEEIEVILPAIAFAEVSVEVGSYDVEYEPPSGYVVVGGNTLFEVDVSEFEVTEVNVTVTQAIGTLRLQITGVTSIVNGGGAQVTRTDIAGQTPFPIVVPVAGSINTSVAPGTYSVQYAAPTGQVLVAGQTNPQVAVVLENQTTTLSWTVEDEDVDPPPADVLFHSDWSSLLGSVDNALRDISKPIPWDTIAGNGILSEVVLSNPAGGPDLQFPSTHCLKVVGGWRASPPGAAADNPRLIEDNNHIPNPAIGQSIYYRWYIRVVTRDDFTADTLTHPIQDGTNGSQTNWEQEVVSNSNGTWTHRYQMSGGGQNPNPNHRWTLDFPLQKHQTYRFEHRIHRIGANTLNLHAKIFNHLDVQIADNSNFHNSDDSATLADTPTFNFNDILNMRGLQCGLNGISGGIESEFPIDMTYQGCFAVRTLDWCGPYANGV